MAIQIIDFGSEPYMQMLQLRHQILRKPLGMELSKRDTVEDETDILIGCFENDKIMGCCMLKKMDKQTVRLRQMAVHSGLQGKGVGRALVGFAENIALDFGYTRMMLHARNSAVGFYQKLGFQIFGAPFTEISLPHRLMEKRLERLM
ncbi:GNAT family N-acetyltransferase [Arachidicoccus ginsenosidivorans]|jgi:GNAT superfamily N-acetyltransferase|uniref:GNAT family N-acetyltransferase n=1 Tax=Arachidicoccus ginsenosidivorans TaxID=496057 RepID=A0A5B8VL71_9BACT|nr:GNAT family N-acetyltransferase [Arachidicoccus ginsenosidivorans]QEC71705.1 GNAT family N-acetyltransferase [Arachidicoccus ginsenosidivorans]